MMRSPKNTKAKSDNQLIIQLLILGLVITLIAVLVVQNLQPLVEIFFLGQKTLPIPLSVAMLVAFVSGGLVAYGINAIADWQQNKRMRLAAAIAINENRTANAASSPSQSANKSTGNQNSVVADNIQDSSQDFIEDEEDYKDGEDDEYYEDDDEYYEDNEDDDIDDQEILEDDPDTLPYGDRFKYQSKRSSKSDRPPLEAKYIK